MVFPVLSYPHGITNGGWPHKKSHQFMRVKISFEYVASKVQQLVLFTQPPKKRFFLVNLRNYNKSQF